MIDVFVVAAVVKATLAHAALAVNVTLNPLSIITASPATGTEEPGPPPENDDQVVVAFQFPLALEYKVAASISTINKQKENKNSVDTK